MEDAKRPPESPGPADLSSRTVRDEARKAAVWLGMALAIAGVIVLAQPIMLIIGGMVFAVILDGGTRLLGRILPIGRGWRLAIVTIAGFTFIGWVLWFAGSTFVAQFEALRVVVSAQFDRLMTWADEMCFILGFYYRDEGDTEPISGGQCVPAKAGLLCPFAPAVR